MAESDPLAMPTQAQTASGEADPSSPLSGKRVMVTRPVDQSAEICDALRRLGAEPVHVPMIEILPLKDIRAFSDAVDRLRPGDWIFLTSQNAAGPVSLQVGGRKPELLWGERGVCIAAVGPATERKAKSVGLRVDFIPSVHNGVAIADELGERLRGRYVFLPRSDKATSELPTAIRRHGGEPLEVVAYITELTEKEYFQHKISTASVDAITAFSPSEVHMINLTATADWINANRIPIVAIGEVTARACRESGIQSLLVAAESSVPAMIEALITHFANIANGEHLGDKK